MSGKPKPAAVTRPLKRAEYEIAFITTSAEKGWTDALATFRNATVDAWDTLTVAPQHEDGQRVYRLKGDLATGTYEGMTFARFQYKFSNGGRIWYFVDTYGKKAKAAKTAGRVLIERCATAHPNETK